MQKSVLLLIFLICGANLYSQQSNYLYIEAEKGQLFYVKVNDKVYSSSPGGYLILSGLREDSYPLSIGFPKNAFPEQRFTIALNKNDRGYQLKNLGEKGWGLFDLQSMELLASNNGQTTDDAGQVKKTDAFSTLLSKVVNDPAVLVENKKPAAPPPVAKPAETTPATAPPATIVTPAIAAPPVTITTPPATSTATKVNAPVKLSERQTADSYEAVYVDDTKDTIRITYPIDKSIMTAPPATPLSDATETVKEKEGSNKTSDEPAATVPATDNAIVTEKPVLKISNSDCLNFATDQDVDKLRVKILTQGDIDSKLSAAKKYFRTKCFTVKQVKALAELFTQDENKYQLFDIAYPFISDTENFHQLENNLENDYYKNRFRAMIKK